MFGLDIEHNPFQLDRTKHIDIKKKFVREMLASGVVKTLYVFS